MSQGYGSHELPQGRKCYCYGLVSLKPRSIENVWKTLGERSKAGNPKTTEQLLNALQEEWNKITRQDINKSISSCSQKCQRVMEAKGLHTKY